LDLIVREALPSGVTEGLIALLHKGGLRESLNNWRPITLLNVSYKNFAKALQMRLQPELIEVISPDQSAFLPMRFILDNVFLTSETIHCAKQSQQPLLFLKLDFSKAYDKVDLSFLYRAMDKMGFPASFTSMTRMLFHDAAARVSLNGQATAKFPILQGVRQGCPLAPYLLLIIGEFLNFAIKREVGRGRIKGINLPGAPETQIIAQFADDTSLFIRGEEGPMRATAETLQQFSLASGLVINDSKSFAYYWAPQGGDRPPWIQRYSWQWAQAGELWKLLGTPFGLTLNTQDIDLFLLAKIDKKIQTWSKTQLNLAGHEVIANGVMTSTLLYFLGIWGGTKAGVNKCTSRIRTFFWSGSAQRTRARVAWSTLCLRREEGGLNLLDPQDALMALMCKWVVKASEPGTSNLQAMLRFRLSGFQPYVGGKWASDLNWFTIPQHKALGGSKVWQRVAKA
jgi:hypothetical protein